MMPTPIGVVYSSDGLSSMSDQPSLRLRPRPGEEPAALLAALRRRRLAERAASSRRRVWLTCCAVLAVAALDPFGIFLGVSNARFILVLVPLFVVFIARTSQDPLTLHAPRGPDKPLGLLFLMGLGGSLYGLAFVRPHSPALAVFVPMALGFLHLGSLGAPDDDEATTYLRWLLWICASYVVLHLGTVLGLLPDLGSGSGPTSAVDAVFSHEKAFVTALAPVAAWLVGRRFLACGLLGLCALVYLDYRAGTYVMVAAVALITLVITGRRPGRLRALSMTLLVVVLVATLHSQVTASSTGSTRLVGSYFQAVKKTDSTGFRAKLWNEALDEIRASPLVGSAFTGNVSLRRQLADRYYKIPVHSDFLLIGMGGGLVGLGLLVAWIVATNVVAVRRYWELIGTGGRGRANLLRALLVGFNAFFAVALVNPVMTQVGLCAAAMVLYSMLRSVDSPPVVADPAPAATP